MEYLPHESDVDMQTLEEVKEAQYDFQEYDFPRRAVRARKDKPVTLYANYYTLNINSMQQ